ncbi:flagellar biosynthesis anti-sigma factor FlgM [uncultured Planktomarina sp.]|jgi:negative regulator of flagellin synthesis FlgM|uniref:flagellar biosynthesis anti-sigma factor FlgM n=1 Tax=uncultured Planktomarina sp. TaxID=1538529 RepID=UPI003261414C
MVDSIKHNVRQMLAPAAQEAKASTARNNDAAVKMSPNVSGGTDEISVSMKASVSSLAEKPPVDIEVVNKIKQAISDGKYPINLDLVSERLMESYLEMQG